MNWRPQRIAVLGAGVMGSQIAAHFANADIPALLLDLPSDGPDRNGLANKALDRLTAMSPPPLFSPRRKRFIQAGNFDDSLGQLSSCDWVIESITERLDLKQKLWERILPVINPGTILSSNTSSLLLREIAEKFPPKKRKSWLGTHFFNPPRYMKLAELIPVVETSPDVLDRVAGVVDRLLGKSIVFAHDCPNFVANRIGAFVMALGFSLRSQLGLSIEEVDALSGPVLGRPRTGVFGLADLVGLDVAAQVGESLFRGLADDPWKYLFRPDELTLELVRRGWTGRKAGRGFYRKEGGQILALDPDRLNYRPQKAVEISSLLLAKAQSRMTSKISALCASEDRGGRFVWPFLRDTFAYCARCIPEVCDALYQLDQAMVWGFAWERGPFQLWNDLGVREIAERMVDDGVDMPHWVESVLARPEASFYCRGRRVSYFDLPSGDYSPLPEHPDKLQLACLKGSSAVVFENPSASLLDLGEGVACIEFHSKLNTIDPFVVELSLKSLERVEKEFEGLVVGNQGKDFSVGANLEYLLRAIDSRAWDRVEGAVREFQKLVQSIRYLNRPVVAAVSGKTLAGGAEVCLACDRVVAGAESYIGLVEVGAGLIPAGGGTTEMLVRHTQESASGSLGDRVSGIRRVFEILAMGKVSTSAEEAIGFRYLKPDDRIEMNIDRLIHRARQTVQGMRLEGYRPAGRRDEIFVPGAAALAPLKVGMHQLWRGGYLSDFDLHVGTKLARVLCGGDRSQPALVAENHLLELEAEAFLSVRRRENPRKNRTPPADGKTSSELGIRHWAPGTGRVARPEPWPRVFFFLAHD